MDRPNVLFLMDDEHSFRCLSHLDPDGPGEPVHTPTLDRLAKSGTVFEETYCPVPFCVPSRQCMLTGLEQQRCRAWDNDSVLRSSLRTMPEAFAERGYETCLVGKMHFNGTRQYNGFDHRPYGDLVGDAIFVPGHQPDPISPDNVTTNPMRQGLMEEIVSGAGVTEIPESQLQEQITATETISFLREHRHKNPDQPWFVCTSLSRPHFPLTAPRRHFERYWPADVTDPKVGPEDSESRHPFVERMDEVLEDVDEEANLRARAAYFGAVDYVDEVIGGLLNTLEEDGFLENTIVVFLSDHGDMAGEHGLWFKNTWYESSARVPWIVQLPEHREGTLEPSDVSTPVSLLDVFPTLCGLAGGEAPNDLDGVDLSESVRTGREPDRGPIYCDWLVPHWDTGLGYRMVRDGEYKYVQFRDEQDLLYDLAADPLETTNLASDASGADAEALERLKGLVDETVDFEAAEAKQRADHEDRTKFDLGIPFGTGNAYIFPDGRMVDAGTPLYKPDVLASNPSLVFDDWPSDGGGR